MNRGLKIIAAGALALLLLGCKSGGSNAFPADPDEARRQVSEAISQIGFNVSAENISDASQFVSNSFILQPQVAAKFNVGPFTGQGPDAFRSFFNRVLDKYGDLSLLVGITLIDLGNNTATAHVHVTFEGTAITGPAPLDHISFVEDDLLVFNFEDGVFRLVNWGEDNGGHNQGTGGN